MVNLGSVIKEGAAMAAFGIIAGAISGLVLARGAAARAARIDVMEALRTA